jgi:hypothetical protein
LRISDCGLRIFRTPVCNLKSQLGQNVIVESIQSAIRNPQSAISATLTRFWRDAYNSRFPDDPPQKALSLPTLIDPAPL